MSNSKKGQASLEFVVMFVFIMVFFAVTLSSIMDHRSFLQSHQESVEGVRIADRIGYELDMVLAKGDGFYRNFRIPETVDGHEYSVEIIGGEIVVRWRGRTVFSSTSAQTVNGSITGGENFLRNNEGVIEVVE